MKLTRLSSLLVLAVFALVVGVFQTALAQDSFTNTYAVGNQGIWSPTEFNTANLWVEKSSKSGGGTVRFSRTPIMVHGESDSGSEINQPFVLTYVFFNLHPWELRAYENDYLKIYYQDNATGFWKECTTYLAKTGNGHSRVACVAPQYNTVYGIGTTDPDAYPFIVK
jgi:hypothetical protein